MTPDQVKSIVDKLEGLARANWLTFVKDQSLCQQYASDIADGRFLYASDRATCGYLDCWSLYKDLLKRYPPPTKVLFDCEDLACAHAAWIASQCPGRERAYVGLVPGKRVSHAVAGYRRRADSETITIIEPSIWFGMPRTSYDGVTWKEVF
jgi:hypothetical protein